MGLTTTSAASDLSNQESLKRQANEVHKKMKPRQKGIDNHIMQIQQHLCYPPLDPSMLPTPRHAKKQGHEKIS